MSISLATHRNVSLVLLRTDPCCAFFVRFNLGPATFPITVMKRVFTTAYKSVTKKRLIASPAGASDVILSRHLAPYP
jgi:hypothetical protein